MSGYNSAPERRAIRKERAMRTVFLFCLGVGVLIGLSAEIFAGSPYMDSYVIANGASTYIEFYTERDTVEFEFLLPEEVDLRVFVEGEDGNELGDFKLLEGEVISLYGGGIFTLWIYSRSGEGDFICEPNDYDDHFKLLSAGGRLEEASVDFFSLYCHTDSAEVTFSVSNPSAYTVSVYGEEVNELGDFNLGNGEIITLTGGGEFSLAISCDQGESGDWDATVNYIE
jgi:hypothetical protein